MTILFLTNIPSPYRVNFFNELGKLCDLTVLFEKAASSERHQSWQEYQFESFNGIILRGKTTSMDKAFYPHVIKYLSKNEYDRIFVTNPATPTGITGIEYMKFMDIPFILESEGGFSKPGGGIKERFKKHSLPFERIRKDRLHSKFVQTKSRKPTQKVYCLLTEKQITKPRKIIRFRHCGTEKREKE